jgi:hypothetical protein
MRPHQPFVNLVGMGAWWVGKFVVEDAVLAKNRLGDVRGGLCEDAVHFHEDARFPKASQLANFDADSFEMKPLRNETRRRNQKHCQIYSSLRYQANHDDLCDPFTQQNAP